MSKLFWNVVKLSPAILGASLLVTNSALAAETNPTVEAPTVEANATVETSAAKSEQKVTAKPAVEMAQVNSVAQLSKAGTDDSIGQVTSVSQFSDVQPTDWAFQALQSLVERYGCIAGYPDGTFRGNRAMTRYEFAAGLNACLDRVNELIATATANLVKKEDLATLQRLQEEFAAELATLRGRVDALEARTAELEANQFSTTTKLQGEVIFYLSDAWGEERAVPSERAGGPVGGRSTTDLDVNTVFNNRARLNFVTSFTGKDQLFTRIQARNITPFGTAITGTNMTRLSVDGDEGNDAFISKLYYRTQIGPAQVTFDAAGAEFYANAPNFNGALASDSTGSITRYGRFSPILRQGQDGAGITANVPFGPVTVSGAYLAPRASNPADGFGVFDGDYAAIAQVAFNPTKQIQVGLTYAHSYDGAKDTDTDPNNSNPNAVNVMQSTGSRLANAPFGSGVATSTNHYGLQANFRATNNIAVGGWVGFANAEARTAGTGFSRGDNADIFYWNANLALSDLGPKGSLLGVSFGQPPKVTSSDRRNAAGRSIRDDDNSYALEGFYRYNLTSNISVTPGVLVLFNPEHNDNNDTIYVGTLRTTFRF
jgi:hypothetical protein